MVELKRLNVSTGAAELDQICSYTEAVASDERFRMVDDVSWDFG